MIEILYRFHISNDDFVVFLNVPSIFRGVNHYPVIMDHVYGIPNVFHDHIMRFEIYQLIS